MVIDSSALIAILEEEGEDEVFLAMIRAAPIRLSSAATLLESAIVALSRHDEAGLGIFNALVADLQIEIIAITANHATLAIEAFRRFGRGRHRAALNFGDCFSYALAKATGEPLLFKGDDFIHTDVKRAI